MQKVLVTGATGFVGNYVVQALLQKGLQVVATSAHPDKAMQYDWYDRGVHYLPFDLHTWNREENLYDYFGHPTHLIHLLWEGLPNYKSLFHFEQNLPAHYNLLKHLVQQGVKDITVTGTCFEYGMQEGCLIETLPAFPANPYALAKDTLRKFLEELRKQTPFTLKWVRLFYMYGKGQNANSLLSQLETALNRGDEVFNMSGGEQLRDYMPVETVAENIVTLALQQQETGVINCCSGQPISVKQLVHNYLQGEKKQIHLNTGYYPYPDFEPMRFWGDNSRLKKIIQNEQSNSGVHE